MGIHQQQKPTRGAVTGGSPVCGAPTRRGTPCRLPGTRNGRCRHHQDHSAQGSSAPPDENALDSPAQIHSRDEGCPPSPAPSSAAMGLGSGPPEAARPTDPPDTLFGDPRRQPSAGLTPAASPGAEELDLDPPWDLASEQGEGLHQASADTEWSIPESAAQDGELSLDLLDESAGYPGFADPELTIDAAISEDPDANVELSLDLIDDLDEDMGTTAALVETTATIAIFDDDAADEELPLDLADERSGDRHEPGPGTAAEGLGTKMARGDDGQAAAPPQAAAGDAADETGTWMGMSDIQYPWAASDADGSADAAPLMPWPPQPGNASSAFLPDGQNAPQAPARPAATGEAAAATTPIPVSGSSPGHPPAGRRRRFAPAAIAAGMGILAGVAILRLFLG